MSLPTELPKWYRVDTEEEKGWTPQTTDIIEGPPENREVRQAWYVNNSYTPQKSNPILRVQILTPIQVGGGSLSEGMILPAQIGGYPCIPGSSLRGSLLSRIRKVWSQMGGEEQQFWQRLVQEDRSGWRCREIRFESVPLDNVEPYPLNGQQSWQVYGENVRALSVQWQASPKEPPSLQPTLLSIVVNTRQEIRQDERGWLKNRLKETLEEEGIGRGKNSGFGRLVERERISQGDWQLRVRGAKPGIQAHNRRMNITGKYRWSPQVLRATLRGWFLRLALREFSRPDAENLTTYIFGGFGSPAQLNLVSYRMFAGREIGAGNRGNNSDYSNILSAVVNQDWQIGVKCNQECRGLVDRLLELAQRLGGIGPGWRRPPHEMRNNVFRGSEFVTQTESGEMELSQLLRRLQQDIRDLATHLSITINRRGEPGCIDSVWESKDTETWEQIVHGVCATSNRNKPQWCGSTNRPSLYAVREKENSCVITSFDPTVNGTLGSQGFTRIWPV
ncbi:RAMP superfamily CRISPR-associated protein [Cylindrospermopsis raciborskii UAM/DH-BiRr]|uniref:RAMP superfamily CRISPR-associated protein n=2 Tax=Cylindrospermopsis raciborskii TaxID=77022 RepID=UPI003878F6D7